MQSATAAASASAAASAAAAAARTGSLPFIFNAPTRSRDQRISMCIYYRINMADRSRRPDPYANSVQISAIIPRSPPPRGINAAGTGIRAWQRWANKAAAPLGRRRDGGEGERKKKKKKRELYGCIAVLFAWESDLLFNGQPRVGSYLSLSLSFTLSTHAKSEIKKNIYIYIL